MAGYRFKEYADLVEREVGEALRGVAEAMPQKIYAEIHAGLDPAGNPQKANTPAYAKRKIAKGFGAVPLVRTGELASGYVVKRTGPTTFEVRPSKKTPLFRILQARGFNLVGMPPASVKDAQTALREAAERIEAKTGGLKK